MKDINIPDDLWFVYDSSSTEYFSASFMSHRKLKFLNKKKTHRDRLVIYKLKPLHLIKGASALWHMNKSNAS